MLLPIKKSVLNIEIFSCGNLGEKNFFDIRNLICLKMRNITQRDAQITKNYILADKKSIFNIEIFSSVIEVKKLSLKLENIIG